MNRKKIAMLNSSINIVSQLINIVLSFVMRKLFIKYIGVEYLGISTVLSEVLGMLALSELGIQSAIVFRLYKPLARKDMDEVSKIISLFKKMYQIIGMVILGGGLILMPFLKYFVKNLEVSMDVVYITYMILLVSSVISYFLAYKRTLLYADQKQYVSSTIDACINMLCSIARIIVIVVLRDYYLYTATTIIQNVTSNVTIQIICTKRYPELKINMKTDRKLRKDIISDVKNIFMGKIAGYLYSSTDNLVISSLIGTGLVGYLGNYKSVTRSINTILLYCVSSMQPLVGNYVASESKQNAYAFFKKYSFFRYAIASLMLLPTLSLIDSFIIWWLGENYVMNRWIPVLIVIDIYISIVHGSTGEFVTANGHFQYERNVCTLGAVVNLLTSIVGALTWGIEGVLLGTVFSQIIMWVGRSYIVYKHCFEYGMKKYAKYWMAQLIFAILFITEYFVVKFLFKLMPLGNTIFTLILKAIIAVGVCIIMHTIVLGRSEEYKYFKNWILEILEKMFSKIKRR